MALPVSGAISMNQVNVELGLSGTTSINLNQSTVRTLFGVASGAISLNDGHGKANAFTFSPTISSNTADYNIRAAAVAAGWDQVLALNATVTINSGIYVYSTSAGTPAMQTGSTFPTGTTISIVNNGSVYGKSGAGGGGGYSSGGGSGGGGGASLTVNYATSITNNGTIAGGGGGGGGGGSGGSVGCSCNCTGGAGGTGAGQSGAGSGGGGINCGCDGDTCSGGSGGTGGGWGSTGSSGATGLQKYNPYLPGGGGGAGGKCANLNGYTITWVVTGSRYGAIS